MKLSENHFKMVNRCPWCGENESRVLYENDFNAIVKKCMSCGFVFSSKILNEQGLDVYWNNYESNIHNSDLVLFQKRQRMYKIESDFIKNIIGPKKVKILDVGCAGGEFLDYFSDVAQLCEGVEYGEEAYNIVSKKYKTYLGNFPEININNTYDLVIFRGTIQYFIDPKSYFKKAMQLLNKDGLLYITSSPNADSLCFELFGKNFTLPVGVTDYYGYTEPLITQYIKQIGGMLVCSHNFYTEGPYANPEEDIMRVANAIKLKNEGKSIEDRSPAFYDNMLTLVYKKVI